MKNLRSSRRLFSTDSLFWKFQKIARKMSWDVIWPITLFHFCSFPKFTKKLLLKAIKRLTEMESMKEKMSCDLWFPLTHTKISLKQLSEKFVSVKINYLKRPSAAKLYSGIRRCFRKHLKMGLYYLIAESVILQYCFCQQPY